MSPTERIPPHHRVIVALDTSDPDAARRLIGRLRGRVGFFKVGLQLFSAAGPAIVREIVAAGERVFLDLKLHDIPNTAAHAVGEAARMGAAMTDLHVAGGEAMLRSAVEEARRRRIEGAPPMRLLGVTILTSLDAAALRAVGFKGDLPELVTTMAGVARSCGLDGVVASAHEVKAIRRACGDSVRTVVPGIRPAGAGLADQKRAATPREAMAEGADYIVVGRPITGAPDPVAAVESIAAEIGG
jgi:orotidine-5'-phosphate decarboxylase